jgi:hypothetical protein
MRHQPPTNVQRHEILFHVARQLRHVRKLFVGIFLSRRTESIGFRHGDPRRLKIEYQR